MLFHLLIASTFAASGVQAQVFPSGIDKLIEAVEGTAYDLAYDDLGAEVSCWDRVGIRDFNLNIPIQSIDVTVDTGGVAIAIGFDEIFGEAMWLYSVDNEYSDACFEFDTEVYYVRLTNGAVSLSMTPFVENEVLSFQTIGDTLVLGDIDSDIAYFPDDLALYYFEDTLLEMVAEEVAARLPSILTEYVAAPILEGEFSGFDYVVDVEEAFTSRDGVGLGGRAEIGWRGASDCSHAARSAEGRSPSIDFGDGDGAALAVGATEFQVSEVFNRLWSDGYFCFSETSIEELLARVAPVFDPEIGGLGASVALDQTPQVRIEAEGIDVDLDGLEILVTGEYEGEQVVILDIVVNIAARAELTLDQDLAAFALSLTDLTLRFDRFEVRHLLSDNPEAEDNLRRFLQGWVANWVEQEISGIPLYASLLQIADWYVQVNELQFQPGALAIFVNLYAPDDPAIDREAPETDAVIAVRDEGAATLSFEATDDRAGPIVFAYAVDGGGWSSWTTENSVALGTLTAGDHWFVVKSRDSWWNEDLTPAEGLFRIVAPTDSGDNPPEGCGCTMTGSEGIPSLMGSLAPFASSVLLAGRRRRRRRRQVM